MCVAATRDMATGVSVGEPCFLQGQGGITGWHTLAESVAAAFAAFAAIFCCRIHSFMPIL